MRRWRGAVIALIFAAGCEFGGDKPPHVRWGEEPCARCRMLINDPQFAAALVLQDGTLRKYDDVGCLLRDYPTYKGQVRRIWVRRYDGDGWLDAGQAWFVWSKQLPSPMGYGIAAVKQKDAAERLAAKVAGEVQRFNEMTERTTPHERFRQGGMHP